MYVKEIKVGDFLKKKLRKIKDAKTIEKVRKQMNKISEDPTRYKRLHYNLKGEQEVHMGSKRFIFSFINGVLTFLDLSHHDEVQRKR